MPKIKMPENTRALPAQNLDDGSTFQIINPPVTELEKKAELMIPVAWPKPIEVEEVPEDVLNQIRNERKNDPRKNNVVNLAQKYGVSQRFIMRNASLKSLGIDKKSLETETVKKEITDVEKLTYQWRYEKVKALKRRYLERTSFIGRLDYVK
ncbi:hypothetical protein ROZALSC1DRAFT_28932 [Rozella allomycis CSF55]|uniref:Uncharacterized protein n=1 Tax=Rozella allomycis (strain CSF55) TaxID=988480 RepID=A0A075B022_ROZAC|nr:hypothetical protein O9G_004825 [Rozella allomycis CSF55]RKP19473.1 hypothetical protein ROZALSC1DRAFT_28932 [Rozella allomycis CSF55]|eukprot:EPZ34124.1 hypothetical protein O9G_004825 [Rozella allomycis CSF55]